MVLAGLTRKIRFVGTHFFDLRVVLDGSEAKDAWQRQVFRFPVAA